MECNKNWSGTIVTPDPLPRCELYEQLIKYKSSNIHSDNSPGKFYNIAGEPNLVFILPTGDRFFLHHTGVNATDICIRVFTRVLIILKKSYDC